MSIAATVRSLISVVQTFEGVMVNPDDSTATFDQLSEFFSYNSGTSIPVTKHAGFNKAMSAGAGTIDLTALPGVTAEETVDGTALKVQLLKFRNKDTNANKITVSNGASNGYRLDASTTAWSVTLMPGQSVLFVLDDAADDVGGSRKTIDLAGTLAQVLEVAIVLG